MYDLIIIGARCAGASTAMLLAQKGYRVLLVDRATFPSDTLSTHVLHIKGGAILQKWGLLSTVLKSNSPAVRKAEFNAGQIRLSGTFPPLDGVDAVVCPRRTVLDKILVDAAINAGAELREDFLVEELLSEGECVTGIVGREKANRSGLGARVEERARLVIGADGKHSLVAKSIGAPEYRNNPNLTCAYYTYWDGLKLDQAEMYSFPEISLGFWPTNDGLTMIFTAYPISAFQTIRQDIEGWFWKTMLRLPMRSEQLRAGRQAERFYGTADLPAFYRKPYGPGWVLVGDAGMTLDPITGQGISHAFRDAERIAAAVDQAFTGQSTFESSMAVYEKARNEETLPVYEFTAQIASFMPPPVEQQVLFEALARKPEAARQFFGVLTGSVPAQSFFSPKNIFRIIGPSGMGRIAIGKLSGRHSESANREKQPL